MVAAGHGLRNVSSAVLAIAIRDNRSSRSPRVAETITWPARRQVRSALGQSAVLVRRVSAGAAGRMLCPRGGRTGSSRTSSVTSSVCPALTLTSFDSLRWTSRAVGLSLSRAAIP